MSCIPRRETIKKVTIKMPSKGFPQISSMPALKAHRADEIHKPPKRSIEVTNIPQTSSPFLNQSGADFNMNAGKWSPISISSEDDDDENEKKDKVESELRGKHLSASNIISSYLYDDTNSNRISDFHQLPVVMKKQPSMLSLRNRRDQQYQGVRMLKPARIVNKAGDRNVGSINIPEKTAKFFKDIVHTLVSQLYL